MRPANRHGTPVDPVPFLVVVGLGVMVLYSYGPLYLLALGFTLPQSVGLCTAAFVALTGLAYWRYVWTFDPDSLEEVPAGTRFVRIIYGALILAGLLALLALPLFI